MSFSLKKFRKIDFEPKELVDPESTTHSVYKVKLSLCLTTTPWRRMGGMEA
jgi:hypothetical protein